MVKKNSWEEIVIKALPWLFLGEMLFRQALPILPNSLAFPALTLNNFLRVVSPSSLLNELTAIIDGFGFRTIAQGIL
jgi:hypothetical protein